jgi:uncharacterized protein (DUF4415 family)
MLAVAELVMPSEEEIPVIIPLHRAALEYFRKGGRLYQSRGIAILRAYVGV